MMTIPGLWSATIPTIPMVFAHGPVVFLCAVTLLALSTAALWLERERHASADLQPPLGFEEEMRLAA
jgi:hypothetical protein